MRRELRQILGDAAIGLWLVYGVYLGWAMAQRVNMIEGALNQVIGIVNSMKQGQVAQKAPVATAEGVP